MAKKKSLKFVPKTQSLKEAGIEGHELITVEEFAKRMGRSKKTVYQWIREGKMPARTVYQVLNELRVDGSGFEKQIIKRVN